VEECQHAKIDALELDKMIGMSAPEQIKTAFSDYLELIDAFDGLVAQQAGMDAASLSTALGRTFTEEEKQSIVAAQHAGYRRTFLVSGMVNPTFTSVLARMDRDGAAAVARKATSLA